MSYYKDSGFTAIGFSLPQRDAPRNWIVWHFTHCNNLAAIRSAGFLKSPAQQNPLMNVARQDIKGLREKILVRPDNNYPARKFVSDHVPFYFAARSPMLFAVTNGHINYKGGDDDLVFLGIPLGRIVDSELEWCVSDMNAASRLARFSRQLDGLSSFIDFELLCEKLWKRTAEDPYKPSRRAAELLVLDKVPAEMITHVIAKTQVTLNRANLEFSHVSGTRQYRVEPGFYYS